MNDDYDEDDSCSCGCPYNRFKLEDGVWTCPDCGYRILDSELRDDLDKFFAS
jgi:uncharacterized Zn finger protein (UPF0148 family)